MGNLFDFSNPAAKAKDLLIANAKKSMIMALVIGILVGLILLVIMAKEGSFIIGLLLFAIVLAIAYSGAMSIRNSTYYRLAILEACEAIKASNEVLK